MLSAGVTLVNARRIAAERGIDVVETRSARARNFTNLLSVKLHDERRRALGRRHGLRAERPASGAARRHHDRGAARRHADRDAQPGHARRDRRGRHPCSAATTSTSPTSRSAATTHGAIGVVNVDERGAGDVIDQQVTRRAEGDPGDQRRPRDSRLSALSGIVAPGVLHGRRSASSLDESPRRVGVQRQQVDGVRADRDDFVARRRRARRPST